MININKIKLSGQTYNIQDLNATKTVELTQAQYDELSPKDPNTFYVITDATAGDLSNYYTKSETSGATEISTALASKADTLISGTNIKTINNQSILGEGNITIEGGGGGGSITIDQSLDSSSTNAVANSAITNAINTKLDKPNFVYLAGDRYSANLLGYKDETQVFNWGLIWQSDGSIGFDSGGNLTVFGKLETSAITTSISSSSTDAQVPSAKAVYDQFGGLKLAKLTQSEYDALATKDSSTLYIING